MNISPMIGLLLLVSSSFAVVSSFFAHMRGRKAWQGALIGFLCWPLAFIAVDIYADVKKEKTIQEVGSPTERARFGLFQAVASMVLAPILGIVLFASLVSNFYSGEMAMRHGRILYAAREPIVFYAQLFLFMCLAAFFAAAGPAAIIYFLLGRKARQGSRSSKP